MRQHLDHNRRTRQQQAAMSGSNYRNNTQEVIYRKAGDDWF